MTNSTCSAMLRLGSSEDWQTALEVLTGSRDVSAEPLLEYFRPIHEWLQTENAGSGVGWEESECDFYDQWLNTASQRLSLSSAQLLMIVIYTVFFYF